ncbi:hypothetical protein [Photobacterium alginatilyticum]|uniref:Uncharacterized protein n=1 Tax=Photobacterium alginatilyticum TaxID=1775171 RepID=A0ABW9YNC3_9GAMM|nr:hypothetical protein [Photobacterium alginatilyticum]NBI55377.1 hypothetical protein [Photobacterium alginatilyticum]
MPNFRSTIPLLVALSGFAQAQVTHALPENEEICRESVGKLLIEQHAIFSNTQIDPDIRRAAERAIDSTREAYSKNESYCQAQEALQAYKTKSKEDFHYRDGEVNYFGRGNI